MAAASNRLAIAALRLSRPAIALLQAVPMFDSNSGYYNGGGDVGRRKDRSHEQRERRQPLALLSIYLSL